MMQYVLIGIHLLGVALFALGCAHFPSDQRQAPPERTTETRAPVEKDLDDSVYRAGLEKYVTGWDQRIDILIQSIQKEIETQEQLLLSNPAPDKQRDIVQRKRVLLAYQKKLKSIKEAQLQLGQKADALDRESAYVQLITSYSTCLKIERKLREDVLIGPDHDKVVTEMKTQYYGGNYESVVAHYKELAGRTPSGGSNSEARIYYAIALNRLGKVQEAAGVAENVVRERVFVGCTNAHLMYELGEVLIDGERYESAERVFNGLLAFYEQEEQWYSKVRKKSALFQTNLDYLRARNRLDQAVDFFERGGSFGEFFRLCKQALRACPDLSCRREVNTVLEQFMVSTAADMKRQLLRVDVLLDEGKILEANKLISSLQADYPDDDYPALISEQVAIIEQKRALVYEEELKRKDELERQKYEKAIELLESEQYEDAILLFRQLKGTQYETEAAEKELTAIDLFARTSRTKAGQLFLQAKQTPDPQLRKTYLVESYSLLKYIMERYPDNQYALKIMRNLEDVRAEIEGVYPEFFVEEKADGSPSGTIFHNPGVTGGADTL